jgi:hypothetical protein
VNWCFGIMLCIWTKDVSQTVCSARVYPFWGLLLTLETTTLTALADVARFPTFFWRLGLCASTFAVVVSSYVQFRGPCRDSHCDCTREQALLAVFLAGVVSMACVPFLRQSTRPKCSTCSLVGCWIAFAIVSVAIFLLIVLIPW